MNGRFAQVCAYKDMVIASRNSTISNMQNEIDSLNARLNKNADLVRGMQDKMVCFEDYNEIRMKAILGFGKGVDVGLDEV